MRAFLLGAALLATSACAGNDDNTDPTDPNDPSDPAPDPTDPTDPPTPEETARDYDELASVVGAHVRGEFGVMLALAEISKGQTVEGFTLNGDGTGTGVREGLSFSFSYYCNDGTVAHAVVPCDGDAHHSHMQIDMDGSVAVGPMSMDVVSRTVDWEIRDLLLDKARFRGPDDATLNTQVTTAGVAATYAVKFGAAYEQVRFMPNAVVPTSGTIEFTLNADRTRAGDRRVFNTSAQLAYGASGAPTTVTFDGSLRYSIDLTTGAVAKL